MVAVLLGCQQGSGPPHAQSDVVGAAPVVVRPSAPFDVPAPADPVIAIGRGEQHACVVRASGSVDCWGQPKPPCRGCAAPFPPDPRVRRIDGITDAVAISPKGHCFVRRTGEAACIDRRTGVLEPVIDATHIRAITDAGCVLLENGGVVCDEMVHLMPIKDMHDAIAIAQGGRATCVIRKARTLACQFGVGEFMRVKGIEGVRAVALASREIDTQALICVLATTSRCFFLDMMVADEPVIAPEASDFNVPKFDPAAIASATQIAVASRGETFELEALVGGQVVIADDQGTRTVPLLSDATHLTAGCAVRKTGAVACWGSNEGGVLARPTTAGRMDVAATPVPGVANVDRVVAGNTETWALTRDGRVLHWGFGHLQRDLTPREIPIGDSFDSEPIADLLVERSALCARGRLGHVWCELDLRLGRSIAKLPTSGVTRMELGWDRLELHHADGSVEFVEDPFGLPPEHLEHFKNPDTAIKTIQLEMSSCRQFADGRVTCEHTPMPQLTGATALAGSGNVGCAIVEKRVMCWTVGKTDVHTLETIRDATDLQLGYDFGCAVDGGSVVCWHLDENRPPVQVIASGAESIGLGEGYRARYAEVTTSDRDPPLSGDYGCAVMLDHTVQCWGANFFGELLDNSLLSSDSPIGIRL